MLFRQKVGSHTRTEPHTHARVSRISDIGAGSVQWAKAVKPAQLALLLPRNLEPPLQKMRRADTNGHRKTELVSHGCTADGIDTARHWSKQNGGS